MMHKFDIIGSVFQKGLIITVCLLLCFLGLGNIPIHASQPDGLSIILSHNHLKQGKTLKITVESPKKITKSAFQMSKSRFRLFEHTDSPKNGVYRYATYIGISRTWQPQMLPIWMTFTFADGSKYRTRYKFWVEDAQFQEEHIKLTEQKQKLTRDKKVINEENRKMRRVLERYSAVRLFKNPFIKPVPEGYITSQFGKKRMYNGVPAWSHSGVDYGKGFGTPILAANDGIVVLTGEFTVHGNTIVLDHGWGVNTVYNHLESFTVSQNAVVRRGEQIGTMGATGVSTGPHLHWGMVIQNMRVNPLFWLDRKFLYD